MSTVEFIEKSKIIHGDKYDYSLVQYINRDIKVNIICRFHGNFLQNSRDHLRGSGCRKCASLKLSDNFSVMFYENSPDWDHGYWTSIKKYNEAFLKDFEVYEPSARIKL